ncbi:sigma-70 family RNA polymerase sigma factor (plasmid) [Clostridium perfringens]
MQKQSGNLDKYSDVNDVYSDKIDQYSYLVSMVVSKLNISIPSGLTKDDFVSFGLVGLYKAIVTYDNNKGSFDMYAKCKIYNEIIDNIRSFSPVPRSVLDKKKKIQKAMVALESKLNRCPTSQEMMEYLGLDEAKYKKHLDSFNYGVDFSINDVFQNSQDEVEEFFEVKKENIYDAIEKQEFKEYLIECLDELNEKTRNVMYLRYYHNLTYKQIALVLGISESTVGEIHNKTLVYLKCKFKKDEMV